MKFIAMILVAIMALPVMAQVQGNASLDDLGWLLGGWKGEGGGQPGKGSGKFSFEKELGGKVIVRESRSVYPATKEKPETVHEDLLVIYKDASGGGLRAAYYDNEGHIIDYSVSAIAGTVVFLSDKLPGVPVFRLTYQKLDEKTVNVKFEISRDGEKFMTYVEGKSKRARVSL
jgi:hypothetical protein